jgi:hypothetical protein
MSTDKLCYRRNETRIETLMATFRWWLLCLSVSILLVNLPRTVYAYEFVPDDALPRVTNLVFSPSAIGIVIAPSEYLGSTRYLRLDRHADEVEALDWNQFLQDFPMPWPPPAAEATGAGHVTLRASSGQAFELATAYCGEGEEEQHYLSLDAASFSDGLKKCSNVAALDILDGNVWLGTYTSLEGGGGTAQGVVVRSMTKPVTRATVSKSTGLKGDFVQSLRVDPYTRTVWVATDSGLNRIDRRFKVTWGRYWYVGFDPATDAPRIYLRPEKHSSNAFAIIGNELGVQDWVSYKRAVDALSEHDLLPLLPRRSLGEDERQAVLLYSFNMWSGESWIQAFPALVPLLLTAAESPDRNRSFGALARLCNSDDPRAREAFARHVGKYPEDAHGLQHCSALSGDKSR